MGGGVVLEGRDVDSPLKHLYIFKRELPLGSQSHLDQFPVRVYSCPLCI